MFGEKMYFDREFWIKTLQENGFKIEPTIYRMPEDIKESMKEALDLGDIEVLYDNFEAQIIFVSVGLLEKQDRLTRELAGMLVWLMSDLNIISALPVFIISDAFDSYVFINTIKRKTGEPEKYVVEYFSGELTPAQRKILENFKPYENAKDPVEAYNNLLSAR